MQCLSVVVILAYFKHQFGVLPTCFVGLYKKYFTVKIFLICLNILWKLLPVLIDSKHIN